jgi:hypothetical protein
MRLILEKAEVLKLLGTALGYDIQEGDAEIIADPFEVHIKNVRVAELAAPKAPSVKVQATKAPQAAPRADVAPDADDSHDIDDVLAASAELAAAGLPSADIDPDVRGINDFARPLRPGETEEPPGEDFLGELPK